MNIQTKIIALLISLIVFVGVLTGTYFEGHSNGKKEAEQTCQIEKQKAIDEANAKVDEANGKIADISKELEAKKKQQQQNKGKTNVTIDTEVSSKPVYVTTVPDSGVQHMSDTATAINAARRAGKSAD
jgi:hypothetical protein